METFIEPNELAENPCFEEQKKKTLGKLKDYMLDKPIIAIVNGLNRLEYCFTLQSCYGHFVYKTQKDPYNINPLPVNGTVLTVEYRIAYIAFCVDNSQSGKNLIRDFNEVTSIDTKNIQFGSATWFWERQVNSYALQVEPERFKDKDTALLDYREALQIEKVRNEFFAELKNIVERYK